MSNDERKTLNFKAEHHLARQRRMYREVDRERQTGNRESESALENYRRAEEEFDEKVGIKEYDSDEVIALKNEKYRAMQTIVELAKSNAAFQNTLSHFVESWGGNKPNPEEEAQKILDENYANVKANKEYETQLEQWADKRVKDPFMKLIAKPKVKKTK